MLRPRSLATSALLLGVLASLVGTGCRRKPKVKNPTQVVTTVEPTQAAPLSLTLTVTASASGLARITTDPGDESDPAVSPDGKTLLFSIKITNAAGLAQEAIAGADPETGARRTLYTAPSGASRHPVWLRDGSAFVYASDTSGALALVRTMAPRPNAAVSVILGSDLAPQLAHPALAPDGKKLVLQAQLKGGTQIVTVALDGSKLTIVGEGEAPEWSPDGKRVAFVRQVNGFRQIFLSNVDGTNLVQVTSDPSDSASPAWSPNGKFLVFSSNRGWDKHPGATRESMRNLYAARPDGTGLVQLTEGDAIALDADWGKDGWIYFESNQGGNLDIWRLHPNGELELGPASRPGSPAPSPTPVPVNPPAPSTVHG